MGEGAGSSKKVRYEVPEIGQNEQHPLELVEKRASRDLAMIFSIGSFAVLAFMILGIIVAAYYPPETIEGAKPLQTSLEDLLSKMLPAFTGLMGIIFGHYFPRRK